MENGYHTKKEILSQPAAWSDTLALLSSQRREIGKVLSDGSFDNILFTGCGSTFYLSLAVASLTRELCGITSQAYPASELWLSPGSSYPPGKTLLVAISRSGETTETLMAVRQFKQSGKGGVLTLSCYGDRPLAGLGNWNLVFPSGQEQSVAQTRAFTSLYLAGMTLVFLWSDRKDLFGSLDRLPDQAQQLLEGSRSIAVQLGRDDSIDRIYWLGSGLRYGLASELSLKMKEMSLSHSEPFHFLEFRHGPKSMVTGSSLTVGLLSISNRKQEHAVLEDVQRLGGRVLSLTGGDPLKPLGDKEKEVSFGAGLDEWVHSPLYIPFGQLFALERSLAKGLNPDQPLNLDQVVKIN